MKKSVIAFAALLIAAGTSVGAYLAVKDKDDKKIEQEAEKTADLHLFDFDPESINKLEFTTPDESFTAELVDDKWVLTDGGSFDLEQDYLNLICSYTSTLTAANSYDGDFAQYGLDTPNSVTLYSDGESYTLHVGDLSPTAGFYYVSADNKDKVYAVETLNGSALGLDGKWLRTKSIVPYSDSDIQSLTFKKDGKVTCQLDWNETDGWYMSDKYDFFNFDPTEVSMIITTITRIEVQDILENDPSDLSKYGLDKPHGEAIITGKDGVEHRIITSEPYGDGNYCYVLLCDDNQVESCYTSDMDFIDRTPFDFIVQSYYNPDYSEVSSFTVEFEGKKDSFTYDNATLKGTLNGKEFDLNVAAQLEDFKNLYFSFSNVYLSGLDLDLKPELKDPLLTAEYQLANGETHTYQVVDAGNDSAYIFLNGEYSGQIMPPSNLKGKNTFTYFLDKFKNDIGAE